MNLRHRFRPGPRVLAGGVVGALAALIAIFGGATGQTGEVASGTTGPSAAVTRRDLSTSSSATGSLQRTAERTIAHLAAQVITDDGEPGGRGGGATITALAATGSMVDAGTVLYRADAEPVVALIEKMPAYRELNSFSTDGVDNRQLEDNLAALGYGTGLTVDENFTDATAEAVRHWEENLGRADPDGTVELGDVVFLSEPAEIVRHDAAVGDPVSAGSPVLTIAGRTDVVLADVTLAVARNWVSGAPVELRWPDGTTQPATVIEVGRAITDPGDGAAPTVEVTIMPTGDTATHPVGSEVTAVLAGEKRDGALVVPVSALLAAPDSTTAVRLIRPDGEVTVPVTAGLVDDSWVEITTGLAEGDQVRLPS